MSRTLQSSLGGEIALEGEGERRLVCAYPGRFVDALLWVAATVFGVASLALVTVGLIRGAAPQLYSGIAPALLFVAFFGWQLRMRRRRMGVFVLDLDAGTLVHRRGGRTAGEWPLGEVRFGTALDPFHRGLGFQHWLVARVPDGRRLRLGKGRKDDLLPVLQLFARWGLGRE